jgi:cell wall-associated NlpC family hydrolase
MPAKGTYLAIAGIGFVFLWSGLKGKSWSSVLRSLVSGDKPSTLASVNPITQIQFTGNPNATAETPGAVSGSINGTAIANAALRYQGHPYLFGGAPGPSGQNPWDCSSFVNWILNHDLISPIPGFSGREWNPSTHGPTTLSYLAWFHGVPVTRAGVQAGDIVVWTSHMGVAINNSQMISALNERLGTEVTGIENGGPGGSPVKNIRLGLCR